MATNREERAADYMALEMGRHPNARAIIDALVAFADSEIKLDSNAKLSNLHVLRCLNFLREVITNGAVKSAAEAVRFLTSMGIEVDVKVGYMPMDSPDWDWTINVHGHGDFSWKAPRPT